MLFLLATITMITIMGLIGGEEITSTDLEASTAQLAFGQRSSDFEVFSWTRCGHVLLLTGFK